MYNGSNADGSVLMNRRLKIRVTRKNNKECSVEKNREVVIKNV